MRFRHVSSMLAVALAAAGPACAERDMQSHRSWPAERIVFDDCSDANWCPAMIALPGGEFFMGSPASELGRYADESPQFQISVSAFAVSAHEITFDQWEACASSGGCADNPAPDDASWGRGARPVINVSWSQAREYASWLSAQTGQHYRLLTETEWEYAARAGANTRFSWGELEPTCATSAPSGSNFEPCADDRTIPVGSFPPNGFGLFDMHGNVWEWVEDCYARYPLPSAPRSQTQSNECALRVIRGGSWGVEARDLRTANRFKVDPTLQSPYLGFRVARSP